MPLSTAELEELLSLALAALRANAATGAPPPPPAALMTEQPLIDWRDYSARARNWLRTASELVMQSQPR